MPATKLIKGRNETKTVATTVLSVFGASDWGSADAGYVQQRTINLHVISGSDVYFKVVPYATTLTGLVSSTEKGGTLSAGQILSIELASQEMLVVLSASSSSVNGREVIHQ